MIVAVKTKEMPAVEADVATSLCVDPWSALTRELDAWQAAGRRATLWWRDDDATRCGAQLSRLFDVAGAVPLTLAVIPKSARNELAAACENHAAAGGCLSVVQHGFAHISHAPPTEKTAEYGRHRPDDVMIAELAQGREILEALFGDIFLPVLTPPWNRIAPMLVSRLGEAGLLGLSAFGPPYVEAGPTVVNTHVDIIDWHGSRGFAGEAVVLGAAVSHLRARRTGAADAVTPTGLLTHHRDHDDACWRFLHCFITALASHPAAGWTEGFAWDRGLLR